MSEEKKIPPELEAVLRLQQQYKEMNGDNEQISEATFRKKWLNQFAGGEGYLNVQEWVNSVAQGYYRPVDVIADGKVLFTVPPISTPALPTEENGAWTRAGNNLDTHRTSMRRSQMFDAMIDEFNPATRDDPQLFVQQMEKIFAHYQIDVVAYRAALHCRDVLKIDPDSEGGQRYIADVKAQMSKVENPHGKAGVPTETQSVATDNDDGGWGDEVL